MSCRSTPANSAFTTCARLSVSKLVPDSAVLTKFHELKDFYRLHYRSKNDEYHNQKNYLALIGRELSYIKALKKEDISDPNRAALLERLDQARKSEIPDGATYYALKEVRNGIEQVEKGIKTFCKDMSVKMDLPLEDIMAHFIELTDRAPRTRSNAKEKYTTQQEDLARSYSVVFDKGIMFAMIRITAEYEALIKKKIKDSPPRIIQSEITNPNAQRTGIKNLLLTHAGQDPRNGRLEVTVFNQLTRKSKVYAYKYRAGLEGICDDPELGLSWASEIRGYDYYSYSTPLESAIAGMAPKCTNCGQFADMNHGCPMIYESYIIAKGIGPGWTRETVENHDVMLPQITSLSDGLMAGAVTIRNVHYSERSYDHFAFGDITIYKDEENKVRINSSQLGCRCEPYLNSGNCPHVTQIINAIKQRITSISLSLNKITPHRHEKLVKAAKNRILLEEELILKKVRENDWTLIPKELQTAKKQWREEAPILYSEDFNAFESDYKKAIEETRISKKPLIPYMKENVLGGMATRESGQGFGVEIEYEFNPKFSYKQQEAANKAIGLALFRANLIPDKHQTDYHAAQQNGYVDVQIDSEGKGTWSFEDDGSVDGGEIVSPIMYDEKDTWDNLEKVIQILKDNGAIPTENAGSHVHVGTGFYGSSPEKYAELIQLMNQHEDVLYRLASDPSRGSHRGINYASPISVVNPVGFKKITTVRSQTNRYSAMNLYSISGTKDDHTEFRLFDATLDPGAIQTQIKLAVAMTHAAVRANPKDITPRSKEPLGAHFKKKDILKTLKKAETLEEETTTLRSLLDTLFVRREDKAQVVSIFANTRWNR